MEPVYGVRGIHFFCEIRSKPDCGALDHVGCIEDDFVSVGRGGPCGHKVAFAGRFEGPKKGFVCSVEFLWFGKLDSCG